MCGACCIAPSISSPIPGMPNGKAANTRCVNLDNNNSCKIFNSPERPKVCKDYMPDKTFCGENFEDALEILLNLE
jgi:Fe-S-cluster containining protein